MERSRQEHDDEDLPYVKQDMLEEILARLSPKSLMRFKSVSKSFNNLISGTRFCNSHLKKSFESNRIQLMNLEGCDTHLLYEARTGRPVWDDEQEGNQPSFLAQCNGLFCVGIGNDVFLNNPSTQHSRKVPSCKIDFPTEDCSTLVFFGLGYDSSADDYKIVRIAMFDGVDFRTEVKVYSRNTRTWQRVHDFPYEYPIGRPGVFAQSRVHWIVSMWNDDVQASRQNVAVLDLRDYSYNLIATPYFKSTNSPINIDSLDEKVAVSQYSQNHIFDISILTHESITQPWTRIRIKMDGVDPFDALVYFRPLCLLKPGEILIRVGATKVVRYDVVKKHCSDVNTPSLTLDCEVISYVESIVSPYS